MFPQVRSDFVLIQAIWNLTETHDDDAPMPREGTNPHSRRISTQVSLSSAKVTQEVTTRRPFSPAEANRSSSRRIRLKTPFIAKTYTPFGP
jgi:hypothetical protein